MKLGLIGCGTVAETYHLPAFAKMEGIEVTAICDTRQDRLDYVCRKYNVQNCYEKWEDLLDLEELEIISICTPNYLHTDITIEGLKRNKHILLERPIAVNPEDAGKILKANAKSKGRLMVGSTHRFYNVNQIAKDMIEKGVLCIPNMIRIRMAHPGINTYWRPVTDWYYMKDLSGGGVLMDLGVDAVDLVQYYLGEITEVSAFLSNSNELIQVEDSAAANFKMENGVVGIIDVSWTSALNDFRIELFGDKGTIKIDYNSSSPLRLYDKEHKINNLTGWYNARVSIDNGFEEEIRYFINSLYHKKGFISNAADGYYSLRVISRMYESAEKEKVMKIEG